MTAWCSVTFDGVVTQTLIERRHGAAWSRVRSPGRARRNFLSAVAVSSPSDAWAAGFYDPSAGPERTLIEHWNGTSWVHVASPDR